MRMVRNDRNMQRVLTRLIEFVVVDDLRLSVLNMMYHNVVHLAKSVTTHNFRIRRSHLTNSQVRYAVMVDLGN